MSPVRQSSDPGSWSGGGQGFDLGRAVVLGFDEFSRWHGLFAVEVEVPVDRAFAVLITHAPVRPQQQSGLGVGATFYAVGRRASSACRYVNNVPGLAKSFQQPVGLTKPVVGVLSRQIRPHPSRHNGAAAVVSAGIVHVLITLMPVIQRARLRGGFGHSRNPRQSARAQKRLARRVPGRRFASGRLPEQLARQ